ncbi:hypothetical protein KDK_70400 [Dictyobacter kobayashii]|uniref:Protein kinase domain-containing protein n=2 Tax=Dictyobacter kobayashii TaxID=2014872 RepID=A0A402AVR7_9CHLR|nr:hypothetical protein KDK_70400 [Dictyobacter kobayashii]
MPATFRHDGKLYHPIDILRHGNKKYLILQKWQERYKAFDPHMQSIRSIRVRTSGVKYEMKLIQLSMIHNYSLPHIYDFFKDEHNEYLVHDWFEGLTLRLYLDRNTKKHPYFQVDRTYYLMKGLITGLNRFHQLGVIHGDIKPDNIIVTPKIRLVLIDFGAAWTGARTDYRNQEMTIPYASPEQYRREKFVDCRTDQFAVSVILYQMLTGEFPYSQYPNVNPRVPVIPPERINKNVGTELSHIVMKGLSLDKNQRYDTSQAWLQAYLSIEEKFKAQNHQSPLTPVLTPWQKFMSIF